MEARSNSRKKPRVARLPDDLVAEILARVPYPSLCRFKAVSRSWRALCSDPAVRRRCPQTLVGFFCLVKPPGSSLHVRHFVNASGRGPPMVDPSLSFLPPSHTALSVIDCCNGLLLCKREDTRWHVGSPYFVCNPATERWIDLPDTEATSSRPYSYPTIRLGFDPAVSSHFSVFVLVRAQEPPELWDSVTRVAIYSSETEAWTYRQSEWGDAGWGSVFFNGSLHVISRDSSSLLTVDRGGRTWGKIPTPYHIDFIGQSQGYLHAVKICNHTRFYSDEPAISIWVLEDYAGKEWILKHEATAVQLFETPPRYFGQYYSSMQAIHPEHNLVFLNAGWPSGLLSYGMDKKKMRPIWAPGEYNYFAYPYIPCFSDSLLEGH